MCCIFTCCGWMIDLVQRAWTFTMSCIIMSAVGGVMVTSSMSGIALGYNYSLAEYIDLKETNVSVYLKRGVFDDEIADDMDWRRAGHLPVEGHLKDQNLRTGAPADDDYTTQRSGRRLDDSVYEADDQNRYEGSLMKLTAKPMYQDTSKPRITDDTEFADSVQKFSMQPMEALDQMKAIQSMIDSRRVMATGGPTASPLATYEAAGPILPYLPSINNPNIDAAINPEAKYRRLMAPGPGGPIITGSPLNPARMAVPDPGTLQNPVDWLGPKQPGIFVLSKSPEFFIPSPTYPRPVTVAPLTVRPPDPHATDGRRHPDSLLFPYHNPFSPRKETHTPPAPTRPIGQEDMDKQPDFYNEKIIAEGNEFSKNENIMKRPKMGHKTPEEEYEDEIKGLPVRKRRSIIDTLDTEETNPTEINIIRPVNNESPKSIGILSYINNIFNAAIQTISNKQQSNKELNIITDKNQSLVEENNDLEISFKMTDKDTTKQQMGDNEQRKSDVVQEVTINPERDLTGETTEKSLLDHLVTSIRTKEASLVTETTPNDVVTSTAKKIIIKTRRRSFESKIVSSKYAPNNLAKRLEKKQPFSNQEILNSISVGLNEAGLLRNPASSTLVKLLQSTLNA